MEVNSPFEDELIDTHDYIHTYIRYLVMQVTLKAADADLQLKTK